MDNDVRAEVKRLRSFPRSRPKAVDNKYSDLLSGLNEADMEILAKKIFRRDQVSSPTVHCCPQTRKTKAKWLYNKKTKWNWPKSRKTRQIRQNKSITFEIHNTYHTLSLLLRFKRWLFSQSVEIIFGSFCTLKEMVTLDLCSS